LDCFALTIFIEIIMKFLNVPLLPFHHLLTGLPFLVITLCLAEGITVLDCTHCGLFWSGVVSSASARGDVDCGFVCCFAALPPRELLPGFRCGVRTRTYRWNDVSVGTVLWCLAFWSEICGCSVCFP